MRKKGRGGPLFMPLRDESRPSDPRPTAYENAKEYATVNKIVKAISY